MRTVPTASKKLGVGADRSGPLASDVRWLMLLCPLCTPGGPTDVGEWRSEEPAVVALCVDGAGAALLEKLRNAGGGGRGAVLLRLRVCDEKRGTLGGSAASGTGSFAYAASPGTSGTAGVCAANDLFQLFLPLATRMESRIGLRLKAGGAGARCGSSFWGTGGRVARSLISIDE